MAAEPTIITLIAFHTGDKLSHERLISWLQTGLDYYKAHGHLPVIPVPDQVLYTAIATGDLRIRDENGIDLNEKISAGQEVKVYEEISIPNFPVRAVIVPPGVFPRKNIWRSLLRKL